MIRVLFSFVIFCFLISWGMDLDAKRRKKKKKKKHYRKESTMLPEEKENFEEKFVYEKNYKKVYQLGAYMVLFNEDGIEDQDGTAARYNFIGAGLLARLDLSDNFAFFPEISYMIFDQNKVFGNHTKNLTFGFFELGLGYRIPIKKDVFDLFLVLGGQAFYSKLSTNYSTSSINSEASNTNTEITYGASASFRGLYYVTENISLLMTGKFFPVNPDMAYAFQWGLLFKL